MGNPSVNGGNVRREAERGPACPEIVSRIAVAQSTTRPTTTPTTSAPRATAASTALSVRLAAKAAPAAIQKHHIACQPLVSLPIPFIGEAYSGELASRARSCVRLADAGNSALLAFPATVGIRLAAAPWA